MVLISFNFYLSVKLLISPSYLNEIFAGQSNLSCMSFSFITLFGCFTLDLSCFGHSGFFKLGGYFLPHFRKDLDYYLLKYFLMTFLLVFFFWDPYDSNVSAFNIVPEVSEGVLISFNYFFLSASFISTILSATSLILSSASVILLLVPCRGILISVIALFIID